MYLRRMSAKKTKEKKEFHNWILAEIFYFFKIFEVRFPTGRILLYQVISVKINCAVAKTKSAWQ